MTAKTYGRILVVTDCLDSSQSVHETAENLARQHNASVKFIDTMITPGFTSRWLSPNAGDVFEMVLADKQKRLAALASEFQAAGISTDHDVLFGKSSQVITQEAIDWEASLVVRYMKGVRSKYPGNYGNTARALMSYCPVPLLFVGKTPINQPNVLACIDTEHADSENESILADAFCLARHRERLSGVYCWEMYGHDLMQKRMSEKTFQQSIEFAESIHRRSFENFVDTHDLSMIGNGFRMENGEPSLLIPKICQREKIDVVVMCSATLNHPLRRYFGSTVEVVLEKIPCSLLIVKPTGFVTPIGTKAATTANT